MSDSYHPRGPRNPGTWGLRIAGFAVLGVIGAAIFALVFGWLVMLLWNWLMPAIFHLGQITFWQAFGIIILAKLVFGSMGRHGPPHWKNAPWRMHGPWRGRWEGSREHWRYYGEYWEKEGRKAFDDFIKSKQSEGEKPSESQKV